MDRRAFIVGGVAAFAAPFPADAEQPKPPRIGSLLMGFAQAGLTSAFDAFRDGLREFGWIEDENIAVEYRWAGEDPQRLPELAAELVRLKVDIIIGSTPGVRAAQHATTRSTSRPPRPSASRSDWRGRSGDRVVDRRRFLLTSLAGAAAAPLVAKAQPAEKGKVYRIGYIGSEMPTAPAGQGPFWDRMRELGWVYGQNVVIEQRVFGADTSRIQEITRELISLGTDVFVVPNGSTAAGVQRVTDTIPIVTTVAGDLVAAGLAASVGRPGGNVTGLQVMQTELGGKHLSWLREIVPSLSRVGVLVGDAGFSEAKAPPTHPTAAYIRGIRSDALSLRLQPQVVVVAKGDEFAAAFSAFKAQRTQAIVVYGSNLSSAFRKTVIALALKHQLPAICIDANWLPDGILMTYGWDREINSRLAAEFVDRILRGARAGDIPLQQPTTFRLGINLKTAKALGLAIPPSLLARADQVIE